MNRFARKMGAYTTLTLGLLGILGIEAKADEKSQLVEAGKYKKGTLSGSISMHPDEYSMVLRKVGSENHKGFLIYERMDLNGGISGAENTVSDVFNIAAGALANNMRSFTLIMRKGFKGEPIVLHCGPLKPNSSKGFCRNSRGIDFN